MEIEVIYEKEGNRHLITIEGETLLFVTSECALILNETLRILRSNSRLHKIKTANIESFIIDTKFVKECMQIRYLFHLKNLNKRNIGLNYSSESDILNKINDNHYSITRLKDIL